MTRTRKYSNIRILSWPNIRIHFFSNESQPYLHVGRIRPMAENSVCYHADGFFGIQILQNSISAEIPSRTPLGKLTTYPQTLKESAGEGIPLPISHPSTFSASRSQRLWCLAYAVGARCLIRRRVCLYFFL